MIDCDVLIVGGGPAGSSCAWRLMQHRVDCLVLDESEFPRTKLCAGWVTPEVIRDLEIDVSEYPHRLLSFDDIWIRAYGLYCPSKTDALDKCRALLGQDPVEKPEKLQGQEDFNPIVE